MTIPSTSRKAGPLLGTGAQTAWPFTFKVFAASDIAVTIADSLGIETPLVLDTDYSVTLNANQETSPGGTVTYPISGSALAVGSKLSIIGDLDYDQPLDLPSGGNFSPLALENQLDRMTMQLQQLEERLSRALLVPVNSTADVQLPSPEANELIGWDSTGDNLANYALSELATGIAYGTMRFDTFVGDGTTTQFALTEDPAALANLDVSLAGVTQVPGTDYTLTSATLVFTTAPVNGVAILARYGRALPIVGPTDSSAVTHVASGAGAVATTVQTKLRESVSVKDFGAKGDGTTDDTAAIAAAYAASKQLHFPAGTYVASSLPNWAVKGTRISGVGVATIKYTGTGIGIYLDAGAVTGVVSDVIIENLTISGNASATYGVFLRGITHSVFRSLRVINFPLAALYTEFLVSNTFDNFVCSGNEPGMTITTVTGMYFNRRGVGEQSSNCTIISPIIEGVSGVGIYGPELVASTIVGGTSEGNGYGGAGGGGIYLGANSFGNTIIGLDLENNGKSGDATTFHVKNYGLRNQFINCFCDTTISPLFWVAGGNSTLITGGQIENLQIDAGVKNTVVNGTAFTGSITDNGTNTRQIQTFGITGSVVLTADSQITFGTWTPTVVNLTSSTSAVVTATYQKVGRMVYFSIYVTATGGGNTTATSANFTPPFSQISNAPGISNTANKGTGVGVGSAVIADNVIYTPNWAAQSFMVVTGSYLTAA